MTQCVKCSLQIVDELFYFVGDVGPELTEIIETDLGHMVSAQDVLCGQCFEHFVQLLSPTQDQEPSNETEQEIILPTLRNQCVWCRRSLNRTRRHTLPEGSERDEIAARIQPREIPPNGNVCYACWVSARRNVHSNEEERAGPSHENLMCVLCEISLHRRRTHALRGRMRDDVASRIYPRQVPNHSLVCSMCWNQITQSTDEPMRENYYQEQMTFREFVHTTNSSVQCFEPGCTNNERHTVPKFLRIKILKSTKVFVTDNARVCAEHKTVYDWEFLDKQQFSNTFYKKEMESMLSLSIEDNESIPIDFENIENIDDAYFKYWTGVSKINFDVMLNLTRPALNCKSPKTALGTYLMKIRTGDSHARLSSLLSVSTASITRNLNIARNALLSLFVPLHLGVSRMTRADLINKNLLIPEGLFGNREDRVPIVICDGTYLYVQKSSNYLFQKKTYSLHKYRNLVKPFLIVSTDGQIIDIFGPYPATESDSDIMKALFQNENSQLRNFFQQNDVFILDRGFRDAIPLMESLGYKIFKPDSLKEGETQLPTIKANNSRCVTLCRWVVEVVNGRFKRDFKLLRHEYFNQAATHLMDDVRICAAMLNAFHPLIQNRPDVELILNRALERKYMPNQLGALVISNRINRYRAQFTRINSELPELDIFPEMTMSDLILFGLGTYQIKQARSYYGEHLRQHGSFQIEISRQLEVVTLTTSQLEPLLLRGRIKSRHQANRIYYTYILLSRQGSSWDEKIISYYCSCVAGQRTVGCCAHTMTIVWYLGWARYQGNTLAPASFLDGMLLDNNVGPQ